jgi:hypothetical protein
MKYPVIGVCLAFVLSVLTSPGIRESGAGEDPRRLAITDPAEAGIDFFHQGEYVGWVADSRYGRRHAGLQVVARGGGQFEAVLFDGGLPGAGADTERKTSLAGALDGDLLQLEGEERIIVADGQRASIHDTSGSLVGELQKILRSSPTLGARPPRGAVVLFDGTSTEHLDNASVTDDGLLEVGATTAMPVQDFQLHVEFRLPFMPNARGQGRANSGVYMQRRYEVQILDSFGLEPLFDGSGSLYRQQAPDVNSSLPPLTWQTFDIWFRAPRFDDEGNEIANARLTVLMNGVPVHSNREVVDKTGAGRPEGPEPLPILFQNHGNPVHFRNLWIVLGEPTPIRVAAAPTRRVQPRRVQSRRQGFPVLRRVIGHLHTCR